MPHTNAKGPPHNSARIQLGFAAVASVATVYIIFDQITPDNLQASFFLVPICGWAVAPYWAFALISATHRHWGANLFGLLAFVVVVGGGMYPYVSWVYSEGSRGNDIIGVIFLPIFQYVVGTPFVIVALLIDAYNRRTAMRRTRS